MSLIPKKLRSIKPLVFCFLFGLLGNPLAAQDANQLGRWSLEGGLNVSFTGVNSQLAAGFQSGRHEFFAGPKLVLSDTYLLQRGPWGFDLGYRWNMVQGEKIKAFASLEYQTVFSQRKEKQFRNSVHEIHLVYGFQWRLKEQLYLGNGLGLGNVWQQSRDLLNQEKYVLSGFSFLFKIFVKYTFDNQSLKKEQI